MSKKDRLRHLAFTYINRSELDFLDSDNFAQAFIGIFPLKTFVKFFKGYLRYKTIFCDKVALDK